jgi:transcription termination/antitermination protein NusG
VGTAKPVLLRIILKESRSNLTKFKTMNQPKKNWYAVYTRPKWEKKVSSRFLQKGIEHYCPLNKVIRHWSDRQKMILEPLFTSYVFVFVSEREHVEVLQTPGVVNFVFWLKKAAVIRDDEIEVIRRFLNEYENVQIEKSSIKVNDTIRIIGGPLMHRQGNVLEIKNKTIKIWLPSLGYSIAADVGRSNVEILSLFNNAVVSPEYVSQ